MIWKTDNLPCICNGIACSCDKKAINRDKKIKDLLNEKYETPFLKNNHNLRAPNILFEFTEDEKGDWVKSRNDILYFFNQSQKWKRNAICLYKIQKDTLLKISSNRFNIVVKSRQCGSDYLLAIKALHCATMFTDKSVIISSYNRESSNKIMNLIKDIYQTLPFFMKCGVNEWKSNLISFDNGSRIFLETSFPSFIGRTYDLVILNDFSHFTDKKATDVMRYIYPVLAARTNSELLIVSEPNGDNHFKRLVDVDDKNTFFKKHYIHWSDIPGRDENWKKNLVSQIGIEAFAQEYENLFIGTKGWNRYFNLENLI